MSKRNKITMGIAAPVALFFVILNLTTRYVFEHRILQDLMVVSLTVVVILLVQLSAAKKPN